MGIDRNLWTLSHAGCLTGWQPCDMRPSIVSEVDGQQYNIWDCGRMELDMSYVNSSRYESETKIQTAERKIQEAKEALAQAHEDLQKAKRSTRFGVEPSSGSILKFEKRYRAGDTPYYYAAIRIGQGWYLTCSEGLQRSPMTWEGLKRFIGDGKCWVPRNYELMPSE